MSTVGTNTDPQKSASDLHTDPAAAAVHCFVGDTIVLDSLGNAKPGVAATGLIARGVCDKEVDNTSGAAGDVTVDSRAGVFARVNSAGGDEITAAEIGDECFIVDSKTVAKTNGSATRSVAGKIDRLEGGLVFVEVGIIKAANGDLLASNNLSDVNSAATSRANILANKIMLSFEGISSKASDAEVMRWVAPFACSIVNFYTVLNAALATADATVQAKKNGSNIGSTTTGLATITQSGSAAGDVDSATPLTTNLTLAAGDILSFTVGGGSTATGTLNLSALLTY